MTQSVNTSLQLAFACPLSSGMHARPASRLAEVANNFASDCILTNLRSRSVANVKSVLAIISADIRQGDHCSLEVNGTDEQAAIAALREFVEQALPNCEVPLAGAGTLSRSGRTPRVLQAAGVSCSFGLPVSPGIAHGRVVVLKGVGLPSDLSVQSTLVPERELDRIKRALAEVHRRIREKLTYAISSAEAAVLQANQAIASDVSLAEKLTEHVSQGKSAGQAVVQTGQFFSALLRHSESEQVRERALDIEEICQQLLGEIYGADLPTAPVELYEPSVIVAETATPQQLLAIERRWLKALVLEHSGATSHAVILARSLGIPTLVGVKNARLVLLPGREVVVDANRGFVVPEFSPIVRRFYEQERRTLEKQQQMLSRQPMGSAITKKGKCLEVAANVSSLSESALAFENNADGIGLFRTEMVFLQRHHPPSEEEQFALYARAARAAAGRPVIIRTFDVGGDKPLPYLILPPEDNPFLGYRGVRIYEEHQELLQAQLRAILRASALGRVQIMAPMISSLEEVLQFKTAVSQAKQDLTLKGIAFQPDIQIGMMIEVPSVAFILGQLCAEVDFFNIGTNDLSQYFFAADRGNPKVAGLASVRHPGFLSFLKQIVEQIHQAGKWVGMCGEMAHDIRLLPVLIGLGLDEISLPAAEIPNFKRRISQLAADSDVLTQVIACRTTAEVDDVLARGQSLPSAQPLLSEKLVLLGSKSRSKEEAIQEIVDAFFLAGRTEDRYRLEEALWAREDVHSSGLGYGVATPHCKTEAVAADSIGVLKLREPIDWGPIDREPVRMIILIAMRQPETRHMQVFSVLARKLMNDDFRERLLTLDTPNGIVNYLAKQLEIPLC